MLVVALALVVALIVRPSLGARAADERPMATRATIKTPQRVPVER